MEPHSSVMNVEQAAKYLGLATSTLNKWRCCGDGPTFLKLGRSVRYRVADLDQYLENCERETTLPYQ